MTGDALSDSIGQRDSVAALREVLPLNAHVAIAVCHLGSSDSAQHGALPEEFFDGVVMCIHRIEVHLLGVHGGLGEKVCI